VEVLCRFLVLFQAVGGGSRCINFLLFFSVNLKKNQDHQQLSHTDKGRVGDLVVPSLIIIVFEDGEPIFKSRLIENY